MKTHRALAALALAALVSCDRGGGDDDGSKTVVPGGPESFVKAGTAPPVILTFNVSFAENVPLQLMQDFAKDKIEPVNDALWSLTEGQIRIGKIRMRDNAHPGSKSDEYNQGLDLSKDDIVVWNQANFPGPGIAYVLVGAGRFGRFMGVPQNIAVTTFLHELGHFVFELSWTIGPVLIDEYDDKPDDIACIMELNYTPLKLCSASNHLSQPGQPHSCWTQVLIDYPAFSYSGMDFAPPPPPPTFEYTDTPAP